MDVNDIKKHYAWFSAIQGFYVVSRNAFLSSWRGMEAEWPDEGQCFGPEPTLWKTIGDEVIFEKILTDHRQLAVTLQCWIEAVKEMKSFIKGRSPSLDVKCSAWLAGFPIRNKEVVLSYTEKLPDPDDYNKASGELLNTHYIDPDNSDLSIDYVGPSIDIGFRVSSFSSPREFVLSLGIPYILSLTSPTQNGLIGDFPIFYGGAETLKGVLGGTNYPIFWIDMSSANSVAFHEDQLTGSRPAARDDVRRYCEAFYRENEVYTHRPFIYSDSEQQISARPEWWDTLHTNLVKNFNLKDVSDGVEPDDAVLEADKPVAEDDWPAMLNTLISIVKGVVDAKETEGQEPDNQGLLPESDEHPKANSKG